MAVVQAIMRDERPPTLPESSQSGASYAPLWAIAKRCWSKAPRSRPSMANVERILRGEAEVVEEKVDHAESDDTIAEGGRMGRNEAVMGSDASKTQETAE